MNDYIYVQELGKGTFGKVVLMINKESNNFEAIKFIEKKKGYNIQTEIINHSIVSDHSNIVKFNHVFVEDDYICMSMEYAYSGDMFTHVLQNTKGILPESLAKNYFIQIICGVNHCHLQGICHRDIKLENLVLIDGTVKLCDFGYSIQLADLDKHMVGTLAYMSPEMLCKKNVDGTKSDIWSCGVALYIMLFGKYPFVDKDDKKNAKAHVVNIVRSNYTLYDNVSEECRDFLQKIFVVDPLKRMSIMDMFSHPWLKL